MSSNIVLNRLINTQTSRGALLFSALNLGQATLFSARRHHSASNKKPPIDSVILSQLNKNSLFDSLKPASNKKLEIFNSFESTIIDKSGTNVSSENGKLKFATPRSNYDKIAYLNPLESTFNSTSNGFWIRVVNAKNMIVLTFFPENYPSSVVKEYAAYTKWCFIHNVLGSAASVLSMQSMLFAIGLGSGAIPLSAALTWVLKDGIGQLGGVVYASLLGRNFDRESKRLKFWSTVWLQAAVWLEMLTPIFPSFFLLIASIANVAKNICYLTLGATKASINKSLSTQDNLGDVTAKSGSQATAAGLVGTMLGIGLSSLVGSELTGLIFLFVPMSIVAILANYKALKSIKLRSLNLERISLILDDVVKLENGTLCLNSKSTMDYEKVSKYDSFVKKNKKILQFSSGNLALNVSADLKSVINNISLQKQEFDIHINPNLNKNPKPNFNSDHKQSLRLKLKTIFHKPSVAFDPNLFQVFTDTKEKYYLISNFTRKRGCSMRTKLRSVSGNKEKLVILINLLFNQSASEKDKLKGIYQAYCLALLTQEQQVIKKLDSTATEIELSRLLFDQGAKSLKESSYEYVNSTYDQFSNLLSQLGWNINSIQFDNIQKELEIKTQAQAQAQVQVKNTGQT